MEPLKEAVEAWLQRVRAPILGYSVLAGLAINWKALWALMFSDIDVFSRFFYFDLKTDVFTLFVLPVLVGFVSAALSPWIGLLGAYIVRKPAKLQRELQRDARVDQEIYQLLSQARIEDAKAEEERARESRKLAEAKRDREAEELGPEAVQTLRQARATVDQQGDDVRAFLSEIDEFAIRFLGIQPGAVRLDKLGSLAGELEMFREIVSDATPQRYKTELEDAFQRLRKLGLVKDDGFGRWTLTSRGYSEYDRLSKAS